MSAEKIGAKDLNKISNLTNFAKLKKSKVDINDLLHKVRAENNKGRKENYMFLGLVISVLAITGIIASL